ncbi:MAG TPA: FkbM family methyltransferase [Thermoleophilaceae bacterium]
MREALYRRSLRHPRVHDVLRRGAQVGRHLARRPHDPDFAAFALWPERDGLFLDVGANTGASALAFRIYNRRSPILSIEPNPLHEPDLRAVGRLIRGFDYMLCGASDEPGELTLYTPVIGRVPLTGESSLSREIVEGREPHLLEHLGLEQRPGTLGIVETTVRVRPLDELELAPAFVKLDVQGWELHVIAGLRRTLERHRPVLFVENGPYIPQARELLGELGYEARRYDHAARRLAPFAGEEVMNVLFVAP